MGYGGDPLNALGTRKPSRGIQVNLYGRNPLDLYLWAESFTCKGCAHEARQHIGGDVHVYCGLGKKYGQRCKHYAERPTDE